MTWQNFNVFYLRKILFVLSLSVLTVSWLYCLIIVCLKLSVWSMFGIYCFLYVFVCHSMTVHTILSYHCLYFQKTVWICLSYHYLSRIVCLISVLSLLLTVYICLSFNVCTYNFVLSLSVFSKTCLILSVLSLSVLICPSYHCSVFTSFCPIK